MANITNFFVQNIALIDLFQSIVFFITGGVIWATTDRGSKLEIVKGLPFLSAYAIFTGFSRFIEFLYFAPGYGALENNAIVTSIHTIDYLLAIFSLLIFGLILIKEIYKKIVFTIAIILIAIWFVLSAYSLLNLSLTQNSLLYIRIITRYFIAGPAFLISSMALFGLYYKYRDTFMRRIARLYSYLAVILLIDVFVFGLIPPEARFFPANVVNDKVFLETVGLPIQFFRAAIAILILSIVVRILKVFKLESELKAKKLSEQKRISAVLQQSLFPRELPVIKNHQTGVYYQSATVEATVGGDFYDYFRLPKGRIGLIFGDVSGKGVEVAAYTSMVKNALSAYAFEEEEPSKVMQRVNNFVTKKTKSDLFVTILYLVYKPESGSIAYVNAGHPYPLIINRSSGKLRLLGHSDLVIGVQGNQEYIKQEAVLNEGEILLFYTDGLLEARQNGELFGETRIAASIRENRKTPAAKIPETLCTKAIKFSKNVLIDDILVLAMERE